MRPAADGVELDQLGVEAVVSAPLEEGAHLRVLPGDFKVVHDGLHIERRPADQQRAVAPLLDVCDRARACCWNHTTVPSSHGSSRSSRWWRTSACSAAVGLAVPMSMPRYTCMESTDTSSQVASCRASSRASADFPDAVGPDRTSRPVTWARPTALAKQTDWGESL